MKNVRLVAVCGAVAAVLVACAHGPVVPTPPSVSVRFFNSTLITPQVMKLEAKIVIHNNMNGSLDFEKADYGLSLFDKSLVNKSFTGMETIRANGDETVTFPFTVSMDEILAQKVAILAEGGMPFTFHSVVYPALTSTLGPVEVQRTIKIPLPSIPLVSFQGTQGAPLSREFRIFLAVMNTNSFPIEINSVSSYLVINDQRYSLLHSNGNEGGAIAPGAVGQLTLSMENSATKLLSMALSVLQNQKPQIKVQGQVTFGTRYGWVVIPIEVEGKTS